MGTVNPDLNITKPDPNARDVTAQNVGSGKTYNRAGAGLAEQECEISAPGMKFW